MQRFWLGILSALVLAAPAAQAQSGAAWDDANDDTGFGARLGLGFTADPGTFLIDLAAPYSVGSGASIGPRIQIGLADNSRFIGTTIDLGYSHDLGNLLDGALRKLRPSLHAGIGFASLYKAGRPGKDSGTGFLVDVGLGFEYPLAQKFTLGSQITVNIMPGDVVGETIVFSWQLLQMRLAF